MRLASRQLGQVSGAQQQTIRILAVRVDFIEDATGLTTGNGKFQFAPDSTKTIEVPPHDLTYFEHQLLALSNYFDTVSNGQLLLETDVYPKESHAAFTLANEMTHYSPVGDDALLDQRLAELLRDGFQAADQAGGIDFSQYDVFIMFHAGVGSDFSLDFDPSPQDIPSVFLGTQELRAALGNNDPTYQGIAVNNGAAFIADGIILPETQSQEGFEIGMLGTMAIMMGNQLGLPILFNPDDGRPGVGVFGLMDQGSGNFFGLVPAEPSAWTKVFLGWEIPVEVRNADEIQIAAPGAASAPRIYKIPINANEYFLLENRNRDFNSDGIALGTDANGTRIEFHWDDQGQRLVADAAPGVITRVSEYDFGLPGSGILIWHIDESVVAARFAENRINADPEHRGVDLEEADGAQDIGRFYGFLSPGAGAENGVIEDMFWGSNLINICVNHENPSECFANNGVAGGAARFTPTTQPDSRANSGANSHISITDFSEPDSVMSFSVRNEILQAGFPQQAGEEGRFMNSPLMFDLDGDGQMEMVSASNSGTNIYVWRADGSAFLTDLVAAHPSGSTVFSPAAGQANQGTVLAVSTDQDLTVFSTSDGDGDLLLDGLFRHQSTETITTSPIILEQGQAFQAAVGTEQGSILVADGNGARNDFSNLASGKITGLAAGGNGTLLFTTDAGEIGLVDLSAGVVWQKNLADSFESAPVVADLDQNGDSNVIAISTSGRVFVFNGDGSDFSTDEGGAPFPVDLDASNPSNLAIGDLDANGFFDIIFRSGRRLYAVGHTGVLKDNFPVELPGSSVGTRVPAPVLLDLDGDSTPEIVVGSGSELVAFDGSGRSVGEFPLSTGATVNATPFAADTDADGDVELAVASDDGNLYVWNLTAAVFPGSVVWAGLYGDAQRANANFSTLQQSQPGNDLMPERFVYNYPNPTEGSQTTIRYRLNASAQVRIKIYDLVGDFVEEFSGPGAPRTDNEVIWSVADVESGVYLARVEAEGESARDVAIIKIAVVK